MRGKRKEEEEEEEEKRLGLGEGINWRNGMEEAVNSVDFTA